MGKVREDLARNLVFYRKKAGYRQRRLAEILDVKNTSISNWENGRNSMDIETLCNICDVLGVTVNDMCGKYSDQLNLNELERAVILGFREDKDMQGAIIRILHLEELAAEFSKKKFHAAKKK